MRFDLHTKRVCWNITILQGPCPCLPPTTAHRDHALVYPQPLLTGTMSLFTPNHCLHGPCPCLPPTTAYRDHAIVYPQPLLTGTMPLFTPNHRFMTCGGPKAFTSTTIFKKCGVKTSSAGQVRYILKIHLELAYPTIRTITQTFEQLPRH